jgi:predicted XRE-type DNA-binding protein
MQSNTKGSAQVTSLDNAIQGEKGKGRITISLGKSESGLAAAKLMLKQQLLAELAAWMKENEVTESQAIRLLDVDSETVMDIIDGQDINLSVDVLIDALLRAGKRISVSIG